MDDMVKYETREIGVIKNPVFVVGQCPGKIYRKALVKNKDKKIVFYGNRTGDLVEEMIVGVDNLFLTNVLNYYVKGKITADQVKLGLQELKNDVKRLQPRKIVCLGKFAALHVHSFDFNVPVIELRHPSYVIRFNEDRVKYTELFKESLK